MEATTPDPYEKFRKELGNIGKVAERTTRAIRKFKREWDRAWDSPGDQHIERIIGEILGGEPGRDPALRLLCASDLAQIIDNH